MPTGPQGPNGTYLTAPMQSTPRIHHRYMAQLFASGYTPIEVAEWTGFSPVQVTKIQASPLFQKEVQRLMAQGDKAVSDFRQELQTLAMKAMMNLEEDLHISDDKDPAELTNAERNLRQRASFDILDRIGLGKREIHIGDLHLHKHDEKHIHAMSETDLRNDVMELLRGE